MILGAFPEVVHVGRGGVPQILDVGLFLGLLLILYRLVLGVDLSEPLGSEPFFAVLPLLLVVFELVPFRPLDLLLLGHHLFALCIIPDLSNPTVGPFASGRL